MSIRCVFRCYSLACRGRSQQRNCSTNSLREFPENGGVIALFLPFFFFFSYARTCEGVRRGFARLSRKNLTDRMRQLFHSARISLSSTARLSISRRETFLSVRFADPRSRKTIVEGPRFACNARFARLRVHGWQRKAITHDNVNAQRALSRAC